MIETQTELNTMLELKNSFKKLSWPKKRYTLFPSPKIWTMDSAIVKNWPSLLNKKLNEDPVFDLYIHIPFCKKLCTFCGCNIKVTKDQTAEKEYIDAIILEFERVKKQIPSHAMISSLCLGGGTPNFISAIELERLFNSLFNDLKISPNFDGVIEADPRYLTKDQTKVLKKFNFKRIILGVQDFNQKVLKNVNREQTFEDVSRAIDLCREFDFENITLEFIYGLALQTPKSIKETFQRLKPLLPELVAFYPLAEVPWQNSSQHAFGVQRSFSKIEKCELFLSGLEVLQSLGYIYLGLGYFLSPKSNLMRAYNQNSLSRGINGPKTHKNKTLIGLGASAISYCDEGIIQNEKILDKYLYALKKDKTTFIRGSFIPGYKKELKKIMGNLFQKNIADISTFLFELSDSMRESVLKELILLNKDQILAFDKNNIVLSKKGRHFIPLIGHALEGNQVLDS